MSEDDDYRVRERYSVTGGDLIDRIKDLVNQGNVRRVLVRRPDGRLLFDIPLTAGVGVGALMLLLAPVLTAIAATAALVARFNLEIERAPKRPSRRVYEQPSDKES